MPAGIVRPNSDIEPIVGIQFGIFSPDEIEKRSVVEITNAGTYDGNEPRIGGLFDPRMGVLDNGKTCRSCGQTNHSCPGHFGHFKLARPVYFIQFFDHILNVLNCVCVRCSKLLIDKGIHTDVLRRRGEARWRNVLTLSKTIGRCGQETEDGCGARQPDRYVREGIARIVAEWENIDGPGIPGGVANPKQRQYLEVEYVLRLFRRILDEDVDFMGLSRYWCRPDWMICSVMPIPPPQVRPSVIQDDNQRSEDDLTHKLSDIIMTNHRLQDKINNNSNKNLIEDDHTVLQYHVATLVDNQIPGVAPSAQRSGRPLKSVQQRLGSKEGRIRYNIQGKRVEFSARSVITPDPNISIGELGVPIKIAMNLTFPEKVTPYNKEQMYKLIQNGADKYPGAKTIVRQDGRMVSLKHVATKEIVLHVGDVINRHLTDGDIVLFNRQPTLHRMSMMGHRVRVLPYNTFRLNVSVTSPYNADFDGDEMNAHIPQSYEAATELAEIAAVPHQIVTPRHAKPVIGIVQDTLVGSYRITRPHVDFGRREFMNMMMWNSRFEGIVPKGEKEVGGQFRWTGQQILSQLLPPINIEMGNGMYKDDKKKENLVKIVEGHIEQGIFDKDVFSKPSKGIVHVTFKDYGSKDTVRFIDSMQNTLEQFLVYNGFSVGISDLIADEETKKDMAEVVKKRKEAIENILLQIHMDLFDNNTGKTNHQEFEDKVYTELNKATEEAGKKGLSSLSDENRLVAMVRAGSKGSTINIAQMMACVGQQAPEGRRIPYGFTDRTLPHYKKYDDGAEARGFVESSFIQGLTPQEFFFHAMSGREGLIDTAVKSVTGDTEIVIMEDGVRKRVAIGDWIDAHLSNSTSTEFFPEEANLELLQLSKLTYIDTCDASGAVSSAQVTAVTRHDPGHTLYDIKTAAGRSVIVTASKSLIVFNSLTQTYDEKPTPDVIVGDLLPFIMDSTSTTVSQDSIVSITTIDVRPGTSGYEKYPKMYDITVPSTLNFALANGLVVRDTADTGYIQRQLVKAMEDLVVHYDGSVRDSRMNVLQFHYGEDGINATKIESASLGLMKLAEDEILKQYGMVGDAAAAATGDATEALRAFAEKVLDDRTMLVEGIQRSKQDAPLFASVNLERVLTNIATSFRLTKDGETDLTPLYVLNGIERIIQRTQSYHKLWAALLRFHLAPHKLIAQRFTKTAFDAACEMIVVKNYQSWVQPGEQVGIIAAQSIGEPSTQMTLNSVDWDTQIMIAKNGKIVCPQIGEFIDKHLNANTDKIQEYPNNQVYLELNDGNDWQAISCNEEGQMMWTKLEAVTRHPVINEDGSDTILEVCLASGRSVKATKGKSFLTRNGDRVVDVNGSELKVGDVIPIANSLVIEEIGYVRELPISGTPLTRQLGSMVGHYLQENTSNPLLDKIFRNSNGENILPDWVFQSPNEFIDGILTEFVTPHGNSLESKDGSIPLVSSLSNELITRVQTLFSSRGAFTSILQDEGKKMLHYNYTQKETGNMVWDTIKSIKEVKPMKGWVYDLTVAATRNFMTMDCIALKDTFHLAGVAAKSNVTRGVPRLKELLKVTQNPKAISLTISLKPEYRGSKEKARQVAQDLELTLLKDITVKTSIFFDPNDTESMIQEDRELIRFYNLFEAEQEGHQEGEEQQVQRWSGWLLRFEMDRDRMFRKNISMDDVAYVLRMRFGDELHLIYSDYNSNKLIMRMRLPFQMSGSSDGLVDLKKFQNRILNGIVFRGLPGIKSVTFREDKDVMELNDGVYKEVQQYVLDTDGSNFLQVMNHPYVDAKRLTSSHVHDVFPVLGIEATRAILLGEITTLFEEAGVGNRHLGLLCDVMTRAGRLMSSDRHGINKTDIGPLAKASFEETEKILLNAALFGEMDPVTGVSANIMMGQPIRGGTGFFNILLDEAAFMRLQDGLPPMEGYEDEEDEGPTQEQIEQELYEDENDACSTARLRMNIALPTASALLEEPDVEMTILDEE